MPKTALLQFSSRLALILAVFRWINGLPADFLCQLYDNIAAVASWNNIVFDDKKLSRNEILLLSM